MGVGRGGGEAVAGAEDGELVRGGIDKAFQEFDVGFEAGEDKATAVVLKEVSGR